MKAGIHFGYMVEMVDTGACLNLDHSGFTKRPSINACMGSSPIIPTLSIVFSPPNQ